MSDLATAPAVGRAYEIVPAAGGRIRVELSSIPLDEVRLDGTSLVGPHVIVTSAAVLVAQSDDDLLGVPLPPWPDRSDRFAVDPADGGVRTRINRGERGRHNDDITAATRFGMVNAFHHIERAASRIDRLLGDLGASALPPVVVVVSAHSGSRLPGFGHADGDFRTGRMRPLSGGHYRVSRITTGIPEPVPVHPTGEIHLGPGRARQPYAGVSSYLLGAAHNPATIYHEFGHHVCRHTADFRLNAERHSSRQRNGKPGVEEGLCDYFAATLLATGRPYGWYRSTRGERRDPAAASRDRTESADLSNDPHDLGRPWAAALWQARERLLELGLLSGSDAYDRAILRALLEIGTMATRPSDVRPRSDRQNERTSGASIIAAYRQAIDEAGGKRAASIAEAIVVSKTAGIPAAGVIED